MRFCRYIFFLCLPLMLLACSHKLSEREKTPGEEKIAWYALVSRAKQAEDTPSPFRINASLRYKEPNGDSVRVSALLWGNNEVSEPLRLDLSAGLGSIVAKVLEDDYAFVVYNADEKTAYKRLGKGTRLANFGVPIPLSLRDLSLILTGRSGQLFLPTDASADNPPHYIKATAGGIMYPAPNAAIPGLIEVARDGNLLSWREVQPGGWIIEFTPGVNPLVPDKIKVSHGQGYEANINVKDLFKLDKPYTKAQLNLSLPAGTALKEL